MLDVNVWTSRLIGRDRELATLGSLLDEAAIDGATLLPFDKLPLYRALLGEDSDNFELVIRNPGIPEGRLVSCVSRAMRDPSGAVVGGVGRTRREDEAIRFRLLVSTLACRKVSTDGRDWTQ